VLEKSSRPRLHLLLLRLTVLVAVLVLQRMARRTSPPLLRKRSRGVMSVVALNDGLR
jgi:hypothetical protein